MQAEYADAVLSVADLIPPGQVLSYGDIAELLGTGGPRQVGAVMSARGSEVCWWRVLRASGQPPRCHGGQAWEHYRREGTPVRGTADDGGNGYRVLIGTARWQPTEEQWRFLDELRNRLRQAADPVPGAAPHAGSADNRNVSGS
ncbi:MGMT family protein [Arthrobacter sp. zg-Y411]|uniref:MGMT family protein n=1 Tax=Arthrobacter zhangbolii TaxID=2886936 RepID=UPI001D15C0CA|nr:MGMT family protein [Arthrobacter zhangbolii]MCC3294869.1 MGMT family protein [Arthrobacter zhangbolii]